MFALEDPIVRKELTNLFSNKKQVNSDTIKPILSKIISSDAIKKAKKISDMYLQKAYESLQLLPNNQAKEALENIANYIGNRKI